MSTAPTIVIGAGIGGLACALALQQRGFAARVYEQATALGEIGAGLHVSPNGMRILNALGLGRALAGVAARPRAIVARHYATGEPNFEAPLDAAFEARFGAPFWSFHRADLHAVLADAVSTNDAGAIVTGARAVAIDEGPDAINVRFEDGRHAAGPLVVAADGVHSTARALVHGEPHARFTGHVAYRGMVARDALAPGLVEPELNIWVGPGKHVVAYPVRRGELVNYVAIVEEDDWQTESWTAKADKGALAAAFTGWHPTVRALIDRTLEGECYKWALLVRDPLPAWSTARLTLLGDAAHPMVPYLAQGAVAAIEDAWVLAGALAASDSVATALDRYQAARLERTSRIQAAAWEQGRLNHAVGRDIDGEGFTGGSFSDPAWIYGYDALALYPP